MEECSLGGGLLLDGGDGGTLLLHAADDLPRLEAIEQPVEPSEPRHHAGSDEEGVGQHRLTELSHGVGQFDDEQAVPHPEPPPDGSGDQAGDDGKSHPCCDMTRDERSWSTLGYVSERREKRGKSDADDHQDSNTNHDIPLSGKLQRHRLPFVGLYISYLNKKSKHNVMRTEVRERIEHDRYWYFNSYFLRVRGARRALPLAGASAISFLASASVMAFGSVSLGILAFFLPSVMYGP